MPKAKRKSDKSVNAYILLDRSGSMSPRWTETLTSINAYVAELAKHPAAVTLATFDQHDGLKFDILRNAVSASQWKPVTSGDAIPRGLTPLFDALGQLVSLAGNANPKRAVIVVVTDGAENCSWELNKENAKSLLERCKHKGWQIVFLGADFDAFGEAAQVGVLAAQTLNMTRGNYEASMVNLARQTFSFSATGSAISFTDEDRKRAAQGALSSNL